MAKQIKVNSFDIDNLLTYKVNSSKDMEDVPNKPVLDWGQLKLLITELQFFNSFWGDITIPNPVVLYIGASPGSHIYILSQLYPWMEYHLYDSQDLDKRLLTQNNIKFYQKNFDANDAEEWSGKNKNLFVILDLRNSKYRKQLTQEEKDEIIVNDLNFQKEILRTIKPVKSLLRLRFPKNFKPDSSLGEDGSHFSFFDGIAFRQGFTDLDTNEFALVPHDCETMRLWNINTMGEVIRIHNHVTRKQIFFLPGFERVYKRYIYEDIYLQSNFDGILLWLTFNDYCNKFSPFSNSVREPSHEELYNVIKNVLENIGLDGRNRLIPKNKI